MSSSTVTVNGTRYTGGAGTFALLTGISTAPSGAPTVSNFTGYNATIGLNATTGNYNLTLTSYSTVWDGGGADSNINTAGNWADNLAPNLTNGHNTFTFGSGGSTATINTSLNAAGIILNRASNFTIAAGAGVLIVGSGGISSSGAAHTIASGVTLGSNQSWDVADALTVSGAVSGTYNLSKTGTGTLTLSGNNTYSGTTTLSAGTIQIGHANALGTAGNITFAGGGLKYGTGIASDLSSRIVNSSSAILVDTNGESVTWASNLASTNTGGLTKNGAGSLQIAFESTYTGLTTVNGGTLELYSNDTFNPGWTPGNIVINNGAALAITKTTNNLIISNKSFTFGASGGGNLTLSGGILWRNNSNIVTTGGSTNFVSGSLLEGGNDHYAYFNVADGSDVVDLEMSNQINRSGLVKNGNGHLLLTASNTNISLAATINAGTLEIGSNGTLKGGNYNLNITNNGTFIYSGTSAQTLSGVISGSGAITQNATSILTLTNAANNYTGTTTINAGTISISAVGALGSTSGVNLGNTTELRYTGSAGTLSRAISVTSGTATVANTGSGVLTLSGGLSKNGTTLVLDGGSNGINVTGAIAGSAANSDLVVDGNVTLSSANSYNGPTTINGNLTAAATNAMGSTTNVVINSGGSLLVTADNAINDSATINMTGGTLSFSGNVTETVGMLTLSANSIIDLGTDSVAASFADLAMGFYNLSVYNWTGTTLWNGGNGNNTDQIYFNRALTNSELGRISFYSDFGSGFLGTGFQIMSGGFANEVIPVPEPETWAAAMILLIGGGLWLWRRRNQERASQ